MAFRYGHRRNPAQLADYLELLALYPPMIKRSFTRTIPVNLPSPLIGLLESGLPCGNSLLLSQNSNAPNAFRIGCWQANCESVFLDEIPATQICMTVGSPFPLLLHCQLSKSSAWRTVPEFAFHCRTRRNHQGLENKIIRPEFSEFPAEGSVRCRKRLGGLLNCRWRKTA